MAVLYKFSTVFSDTSMFPNLECIVPVYQVSYQSVCDLSKWKTRFPISELLWERMKVEKLLSACVGRGTDFISSLDMLSLRCPI